MVKPGQTRLFGDIYEDLDYEHEWQGMPEFTQEDLTSTKHIIVHFSSLQDMQKFAELIGQQLLENTRSIWYPEADIGVTDGKRYADEP